MIYFEKMRSAILRRKPGAVPLVIFSSLGARVRAARIMRGMTGEYLAKLVGCNTSTVRMIEAGAHKRTAYVEALAKVLDVPIDWLEFGIGEPPWLQRRETAIEEARRVLAELKRKGSP